MAEFRPIRAALRRIGRVRPICAAPLGELFVQKSLDSSKITQIGG